MSPEPGVHTKWQLCSSRTGSDLRPPRSTQRSLAPITRRQISPRKEELRKAGKEGRRRAGAFTAFTTCTNVSPLGGVSSIAEQRRRSFPHTSSSKGTGSRENRGLKMLTLRGDVSHFSLFCQGSLEVPTLLCWSRDSPAAVAAG